MLVDLRPYNVKGNLAAESLERANITCNKKRNTFRYRKTYDYFRYPFRVSSSNNRGFGLNEFKIVGELITKVIKGLSDKKKIIVKLKKK